MPNMNGIECIEKYTKYISKQQKQIKKQGTGSVAISPIVAFTASFSSPEEKAMLISTGFKDVLYKPVNPKALLEAVAMNVQSPFDGDLVLE